MHNPLRNDLFAIWRAGVEGVLPDRLMENTLFVDTASHELVIGDEECFPLESLDRIVVIGAGKASAKMALAVERRLLPHFGKERLFGWVNVPEDCVEPSESIHLHGARPAGLNEPTIDGVHGTDEIVKLLRALRPNDLCLCLLSGGGSALLPAPIPGVSLEEKGMLTRFLSASGANIEELNTVRKQLSVLKGGGIRRLCENRRLVSLILSDVLGDPLDVIASGPTVANRTTASDALRVLDRYTDNRANRGMSENLFTNIRSILKQRAIAEKSGVEHSGADRSVNIVLGNNALAVDSAGIEAEKRGYSHAMVSARSCEGAAEELGIHFAEMIARMLNGGPNCLISGGEPTVRLPAPEIRGKGGRNQQLVLSALIHLSERGLLSQPIRFAFLSGGTDGEDGPTDAAGAFLDSEVLRRVADDAGDSREYSHEHLREHLRDYLRRCDSYTFFDRVGGLLKTGPSGTNVCDLRVVVVERR